jgi:transcriptional regulator with XRE-family HTH domain
VPSLESSQVDNYLGLRLRARRRELGLSQTALGEMLHVTAQQIQKYEGGRNRISASMLYQAACALKTSFAYFVEGLPPPGSEASDVDHVAAFVAGEGADLAKAFLKVKNARQRRQIVSLVTAMGDGD